MRQRPPSINHNLIALSLLLLPIIAKTHGYAPSRDDIPQNQTAPTAAVYSPPLRQTYPQRVFFGDTHVHTSYSMDAGAFGARLTPNDAYAFAKGQEIKSNTGQRVRLARPLDFLVVAEHSDGMGFFPLLVKGGSDVENSPKGKRWHDLIKSGQGSTAAFEIIQAFGKDALPREILPVPGNQAFRTTWADIIKAAESHNEPGRFTAFIGYEWTSNSAGNNLHRNVVYRDGADKASQLEPYTTQKPAGSDNPRDLWKWMENYEKTTSGKVLAIAHNGNLSNGIMFPMIESFTGKPIDREYAESRARWEPLYEVTQMKGDGETHPQLSPRDEFAQFERWDKGNLDLTTAKKPSMLEFEYARSALKNGLLLEKTLGTNPYAFGMIGSTDSHTGLATADANNFWGKMAILEPSAERINRPLGKNKETGLAWLGWETISSGLAAVWAKDNSREAIFDAMKRRETYATTGPRMSVRFFGGWSFTNADAKSTDLVATGYAKGVPMGGDLLSKKDHKGSPTFLVAALKDPMGANLDRIQLVKGWVDQDGKTHEKIYNLAWGNGTQAKIRRLNRNGQLPPVGNSVNISRATYRNDIGAVELVSSWRDPDYRPGQSAFYYVRVLEIPTPRWSTYDAVFYGLKNLPSAMPATVQQRAYTSPIWVKPQS